MKLTVEQRGEITVLQLFGTLVVGEPAQLLRDRFQSLVAEQPLRCMIDLSGLDYLDSAGMGELIAFHKLVGPAGGRVCLTGLKGKVRDIVGLARLDQVIPVEPGFSAARERLLEDPTSGSKD